MAGLIRGQILFERLIFQASNAAEEVYFPGCNAETDSVLSSGHAGSTG